MVSDKVFMLSWGKNLFSEITVRLGKNELSTGQS